MTSFPPPRRRLRIERLELDLRGIAPDTAQAAAHALGPALARALAAHHGQVAAAERIDAGRITSPASPAAPDLAAHIAQRIVASTRRGQP